MVQLWTESAKRGSGQMKDDPSGLKGRLGRGPVNWYIVIGLAIGLAVGGAIGALWGLGGLLVGDLAGGGLGAFIGSRLARARQR